MSGGVVLDGPAAWFARHEAASRDAAPEPAPVNGWVDGPRVVLVRRNSRGVLCRRELPAEHACYLARPDGERHERELRRQRAVSGLSWEGGWLRVRFRDGDARRALCGREGPFAENNIPTFEGDVSPLVRAMVDRGLGVDRPRRCYLDIETDSRRSFAEKELMRVLSFVVEGEDGRVTAVLLEADSDRAEAMLLNRLWAALEPYDQVCAWHGDGFDFPVLAARAKAVGALPKDLRRWLWLDQLAVFKRMNLNVAESGDEKQSFALGAIAAALLGEGKDELDASKSWQAWAAGGTERQRLLRYNQRDVHLLRRIEDETGYLELHAALCQACGVFADSRGLHPTAQVDCFMLRLGRERGVRFPTRVHLDEGVVDKFEGAYVMKPPAGAGILRDVHVADFAAMYPSIILSWNISPDTKAIDVPTSGPLPAGRCRAPSTGVGFRTDAPGILPVAVAELIRLRTEWGEKKAACAPGTPEWRDADRRSTAYKVAANSFYGVMGSPFSRFYDRDVAASVSTTGAWVIKQVIALAEARGLRVVLADTDSVGATGCTRGGFADFVREVNERELPAMIARTGARNHMRLDAEKGFARLVISGKKRYAGSYSYFKGKAATPASKPEIKGLEFKRGDAALLARRLQTWAISLLLGAELDEPDGFEPMIVEMRRHVLEDELPLDEVKLSKTLSKNLSEYAQKDKKDGKPAAQPPHVMLARRLGERGLVPTKQRRERQPDGTIKVRLDVLAGTRVDFVITDETADPTATCWAGDYDGRPDRHYLWETLVWPPTKRLLKAAFPAHGWDRHDKSRPPKPRKGKAPLPGQAALAFSAPPEAASRDAASPPLLASSPPTAVRRARAELAVRLGSGDLPLLDRLRALLVASPGTRPVVLLVDTGQGEALLDVPLRVAATPALLAELRALLGHRAV